jgi:hypothetical protein
VDDNITGKRREVMRWRIESNEGWTGGEDEWEEGGREVVRMTERKEGERMTERKEGER